MNTLFRLVIVLLLCLGVNVADAGEVDFNREILIDGAETVDEAVEIVIDTLTARGLEIDLIVDHAAAAASVDLELRPTQVVLASPSRRFERLLARKSQTIGLDLPLKFLVFEDEQGDVQLRYNPSGYLSDRHDFRSFDFATRTINSVNGLFGDLDDGLMSVPSSLTVAEAIAAVRNTIESNPAFRIPLQIDYSTRPGREITLIVFGNPNAGTPLMQASQEIAIDLPQKLLVWTNRAGETMITYNDPFFLAARHGVTGQDQRLNAIAGALANFANSATGN